MIRLRWIGMALLLGLVFLWSETSQAQNAAAGLIRKAVKLNKQKKFGEARLLLQSALKDDPTSTQAHFQLALTLAQLRSAGKACEHDASRSAILRHLYRSRLNRKQKQRLNRNKAFAPIRDTFDYQRLMGLSPTNTKNVERILRKVSWYGPLVPGQGPGGGIAFQAKGRMSFWLLKDGAKLTTKGGWSNRSNLVFITLDKAIDGTKKFEGALQANGELVLPGLPGPFNDDPHECQEEQ